MSFAHVLSKRNRALLRELVATDFKLRYQGSALGYAWSLLRPVLIFFILYMVFIRFLKFGTGMPHFAVALLFGIVIWNFFTEMTSQSLSSIVARGDLIRKIRIPRWIIVLSSSISALINLALNFLVVAAFAILDGVAIRDTVIFLPIILAEVYVFSLGVSLFLAAAFVKYRDISHIWEVVLQGMFFLTPIIYPMQMITNQTFQQLLFMNPMAQAIQDAREAAISPTTITIWESFASGHMYRFVPLAITVLALVGGILYFRKHAKHFAEDI